MIFDLLTTSMAERRENGLSHMIALVCQTSADVSHGPMGHKALLAGIPPASDWPINLTLPHDVCASGINYRWQ